MTEGTPDTSAGGDTPAAYTIEQHLQRERLEGLALSPDGTRLITAVARLSKDRKKFVSALWEIDVAGDRPPRRVTRSAPGETNPAFLPDGSVLFASPRPDPDSDDDDPRGEAPALWLLPAGGGEAYLVAGPPGGIDAVKVARDSGTVVLAAGQHDGTASWDDDAEREKARKDAATSAQLLTRYPIRYWDQYLGPRERRLLTAQRAGEGDRLTDLVEVTTGPAGSLDLATFDITPDGATVVVAPLRTDIAAARFGYDLVAVDVASGTERALVDDDGGDYVQPACSPDGRWVVTVREGHSDPDGPAGWTLMLVDLRDGTVRDLLADIELFPVSPVWSANSDAVFFLSDHDGHHLPFRVDLQGRLTRLTAEGSYTDVCPAPDGSVVYALRSTIDMPPHPVVLDAEAPDTQPSPLASAFQPTPMAGTIARITSSSPTGEVRSWLVLPEGATADNPAPLALLIHGGPLSSWYGWHWRWNPYLFTAAGYAVLLPDPALSTGYGLKNIVRGWGRWGDVVFDDLMAAVDDAAARNDVDGSRMAALGGSFGGYMANWVAGHTNRFRAIVTHASLWHLEQFHGSTDLGLWWEREFGDPYVDAQRYRDNSPHRSIGNITTPMLVTHGEKDYRVPIGEALKLWTDLQRHGVESQFLYFPDENHWILKPGNAKVWYDTVLAFLDHHVRGNPWQRPALV